MRKEKTEKKCPKCNVVKNIVESFYIGYSKRDQCRRISSYCIECDKSYGKEPKRKEGRKNIMERYYYKKIGSTKQERIAERESRLKPKCSNVYFYKCLVTGLLHSSKRKLKNFISDDGYKKFDANTKEERITLLRNVLVNRDIVRNCINCNKEYNLIKDKGYTPMCCSKECSKENNKKKENLYSRKRYKTYGAARERAKLFNALVHRVERLKIFERDKYKCWICGNKTNKNAIGTNELNSPTLDHVQPLVFGGNHTATNLKTACFKCNSTRQHRDTFNYQLQI